MGTIGAWELIVIVILVLVIFGGKRLPELGRSLGQGLANFRQGVKAPNGDGQADDSPNKEAATANQNSAAETKADKSHEV
ncbi:MAG: Sec-independent protein translocase subunit TatA/TatB [Candidatus Adiutrix sp.]